MAKAINLQDLTDRLIVHRINVERYGTGIIRKIGELLDDSKSDLEKQLRKSKLSQGGIDALRATLARIKDLRDSTYDALDAAVRGDLVDLAKYEAEFAEALYGGQLSMAGIDEDIGGPGAVLLRQLVTKDFMAGRQLEEWVDKLNADEADRIKVQLRLGIVAGESDAQMVQRIIGGDGERGVVDQSERWAETLVRTAVSSATVGAHKAWLEENEELFPQVVWIAALDERTCEECAAYAGEVYALDEIPEEIPVHPNCRCVLAGVTEDTDTEGFEADFSYDEWLHRQTDEVAEDALGPGRYALWKDGMSVRSFIDTSGKTLTLDELRAADEAVAGKAVEEAPIAAAPAPDAEALKTEMFTAEEMGPKQLSSEWSTPPDVPDDTVERYDDMVANYVDNFNEQEVKIKGTDTLIGDAMRDEGVLSEIRAALASDLAERDVWMRTDADSLLGILEDQQYKNQFATQTSKGLLNQDVRRQAEETLFGLPKDVPGAERPVYGYATKNAEGWAMSPIVWNDGTEGMADTVQQYGNIAMRLSQEAKDRTSFTYGDSLDHRAFVLPRTESAVDHRMINPEALTASSATVMSGDPLTEREMFAGSVGAPYVETQTFGGVNLDDIDEIVFYDKQDYDRFHEQLDDLRIKHVVGGKPQ